MKPFVRIETSAAASMELRMVLLQQPEDTFRPFFRGRVPSMMEKIAYIEKAVQRITAAQVYQNDVYLVKVYPHPPFLNLDIQRHDGGVCTNWREIQQIKNEIVGPENEAVELFPAESRLVDTANQYHLWVHADPAFRFPMGFQSTSDFTREVCHQAEARVGEQVFDGVSRVSLASDGVAAKLN